MQGATEMQTQKTDLWTHGGKKRLGQTERVGLTYIHIYIYIHIYPTAREIDGQWEPAVEPRSWARCSAMTRMVGRGWEGAHGEGHVCVQITAPHCCTVETSTTL